MNLDFYNVDDKYADYLRNNADEKIPYILYGERRKFLCGIILNINDINYYVPVSSNKRNLLTSFPIKYNNKIISTLKFNFMFPCPKETVKVKSIKAETDLKYRRPLNIEYSYCNKHVNQIKTKANYIYNLAKSKENRSKYNICNFNRLEEEYRNWKS